MFGKEFFTQLRIQINFMCYLRVLHELRAMKPMCDTGSTIEKAICTKCSLEPVKGQTQQWPFNATSTWWQWVQFICCMRCASPLFFYPICQIMWNLVINNRILLAIHVSAAWCYAYAMILSITYDSMIRTFASHLCMRWLLRQLHTMHTTLPLVMPTRLKRYGKLESIIIIKRTNAIFHPSLFRSFSRHFSAHDALAFDERAFTIRVISQTNNRNEKSHQIVWPHASCQRWYDLGTWISWMRFGVNS